MGTNLEKALKFWFDCGKDNLKAAETMCKTGRWSLSMFMCQQTVESYLKAAHIICKKSPPSYIHQLPRLLDMSGLKAPKSIDTKILKINAHYIKARYKEDRFNPKIYNKSSAENLLRDTKEVLKWLTERLGLKE